LYSGNSELTVNFSVHAGVAQHVAFSTATGQLYTVNTHHGLHLLQALHDPRYSQIFHATRGGTRYSVTDQSIQFASVERKEFLDTFLFAVTLPDNVPDYVKIHTYRTNRNCTMHQLSPSAPEGLSIYTPAHTTIIRTHHIIIPPQCNVSIICAVLALAWV